MITQQQLINLAPYISVGIVGLAIIKLISSIVRDFYHVSHFRRIKLSSKKKNET